MSRLFVAVLLAGLAVTGFAEDKEAEARKESVARRLEELFRAEPSEKAEVSIPEETPYLKVLPGKDDHATLIYRCRYTRSKDLIDGLETVISKGGVVEESEEKNMVVINDTSAKIEELKEVVQALDVPVPQVLVESKVIEVYYGDRIEREFSFDYNKADYDADGDVYNSAEGTFRFPVSGKQPDVLDFSPYSLGIAGAYDRIHYFLKWLRTANDARILSSPNLTVSMGSTASIVTGDELPIQTTSTTGSTINNDIKYKRTGIRLDVTPIRINDRTVRLEVNPEVSTVTRYETFNEIRTPVVSVRNVKTELTVQDGEVIMLGGLYSTEELRTEKKVPLLGDLPLAGWLFRAKDNSLLTKQLVFFMKVNIIGHDGAATSVDMEKQAEQIRAAGRAIKESEQIFPRKKGSAGNGAE